MLINGITGRKFSANGMIDTRVNQQGKEGARLIMSPSDLNGKSCHGMLGDCPDLIIQEPNQ